MILKVFVYFILVLLAIQLVIEGSNYVDDWFNKDELGLSHANYKMVEEPGITVGKLLENNENRTFSSDLVKIGYFQDLLDKGLIKINNKKLSEKSKIYITKKGKKEFKDIYKKVARDLEYMKERKKEEKERAIAKKKEEKERAIARKKREKEKAIAKKKEEKEKATAKKKEEKEKATARKKEKKRPDITVGKLLNNLGTIFEGEKAQSVKYAKLSSCPHMTLEEMAEGFMGSHSWSSGKSEDGNSFVNLKGSVSYHEKKVTALIQFQLNNDETFEFRAIELNEIPQPTMMGLSLLKNMCKGSKEIDSTELIDSSEL